MAITTAAGGLRYAGLDGDDRELLETITDQSARMNRMIENLLDLSKLQAGVVAPHADWLDPRELVEASADELQRNQPDGRSFQLRFAPDLPLVRGDASQLQRVIVNLLENARKFSSPEAPVQVEVSATPRIARIAVQDSGPGVPEEEAERIFEPFYRSPSQREAPGSGLGLAIARGLAEANGCRLAVARPAEGGSRFTLGGAGAGCREALVTAGSTRILVVDDERPIRRALEVTLAKAGYTVNTAIDASEALTQAALQPPDLLILDLMLPDADGADVCRQLRDWMQAPILLISAVGEEQDKIRALDAGADDYLTKPFGIGELLARVRALLRRSEGTVSGEQVIEVGQLTIDLPHRIVTAAGNEVHLTPTEFDLLKELALADGRPLTHKMLLRKVWGAGYAQEMQLLRTHMGRLRDKLEAQGVPRTSIETLTGVGYRLRG